MKLKWRYQDEKRAHLEVGVIEAVVFGVPDKAPKSYTWQLHVISGYFAAGGADTLEEAMACAETVLIDTVKVINDELAAIS